MPAGRPDPSRPSPPLRTHQARALEALARAWRTGRKRAWIVLPPGAGKTRVGIETVVASFADGAARRAVVLVPNTAIQAQWVAAARAHGLDAGTSRDLAARVTCLTYQSLAVFDTDEEVADDPEAPGGAPGSHLERLHPNGQALVDRMREEHRMLLVLDECHHLLEVWGELLGELLHTLEEARVLGLTATPPDALTADQAELVRELFSHVVFRAGVPAVVKEGHLAPFAELAWLVTPTEHEREWLAGEATRWRELTTYLTDPGFGSIPFLEWTTARFVAPVPQVQTWASLARAEPELTDAALRLCHAGLLALPEGARLTERHRRAPDADDWVELIDDWVTRHVAPSADERDAAVLAAVRQALPSVGYHLTRRGVRRGRTPVDRVLARSAAKTTAAVEIVTHELSLLGSRTRVLVLCDHERASATLPTGLRGVLDQQSGSGQAALEALVADPTTSALSPMLVTAATIAGAPETLRAFADFVVDRDAMLDGRLTVEADDGTGVARVAGPWSSRDWVPHVTEFFEAGHCQVLVGTRGLLGEGWDARRISGLVDLTTATTLTAVVQTRGRALRTDPHWPDKVAVNWSVVCVSDEHPKGSNDWARLVRKHEGFHGVDDDGDVVDGVSHIDAAFSPYAPPPVASFDEVNARMRDRAADRDEVRRRWRVGEPYEDRVFPTLRVRAPRARPLPATGPEGIASPVPPAVVLGQDGIELRDPALRPPRTPQVLDRIGAGLLVAGLATVPTVSVSAWFAIAGVTAAGGAATAVAVALRRHHQHYSGWVLDQAGSAATTPSVVQVAAAVAEALFRAGLTNGSPEQVVVEVLPDGEHRCRLESFDDDAEVFAAALDEALAPIAQPRYLVSRHALVGKPTLPDRRLRTAADALVALRSVRPDGVVWHPVPSQLGANADLARHYHAAWERWVGPGRILSAGSAEGAGVLAAQHGADPFDATTVLRRHWV